MISENPFFLLLARVALRLRWGLVRSLLPALAVVPGACAYQGAIDAPPTQKFTWFSYLNGDDIRAECQDGSPEKYRFVYNARYDEQLRSYEILGDLIDDGAFVTARVQGKATITELRLDDVLAPWRWQKAQARMDGAGTASFRQALKDSGFFGPPPLGLELNSKAFYWTGVGCVDGKFVFNAWQHPSNRFDSLSFPQKLLDHDQTGVALIPPRPLDPLELRLRSGPAKEFSGETPGFLLRVGEDGFSAGGPRLRDPFS